MSQTIAQRIDAANEQRAGAFIGYLPVGFPDLDTSVDAAVALAEAGADVIELGPPYSDPVMDGPVIQMATTRALASGFKLDDLFRAIERIRARVDVPIACMAYWNLVVKRGVERFASQLQSAGGAGLITPDLITDEAETWLHISDDYQLERIFLAAPTSSDTRLKRISELSRGFVYTVSTMGTTGAREELDRAARTLTERLRAQGCPRACVGIGVSTPQQVRDVVEYADGAIVGTALVRALAEHGVKGVADTAAALVAGTERPL